MNTPTPAITNPTVDWVERATRRTLTDEQRRAIDVICRTDRPHNLPLINDGWASAIDYNADNDHTEDLDIDDPQDRAPTPPVEFHPDFVIVRLRNSMSTFDCDRLTQLVVAAHTSLVRTEISAGLAVCVDTDSYISRRTTDGDWVDTNEHPHYLQPCLEIRLSARQADGSGLERHPGHLDLAQLAAGTTT